MDFLSYIPENFDLKTILVSFDVTSLYANISHTSGVEAVSHWIDRHPNIFNARFSKECILEGLKLVLENNHFYVDEEFYLQIIGTAMGTKGAPIYATLVMGYLENKLFEKYQKYLMPNLVPIYKQIGNAILTIFLFSGQNGKTT